MVVRLNTDYAEDGPVIKGLHTAAGAVVNRERALQRKQFRSIADRYAPESSQTGNASDDSDVDDTGGAIFTREILCDGDRVLQNILFYLDKVYRSPSQKEFHMMFTAAILRQIYRDDFDEHKHRVMAEYGFNSFKQLVLLCCPRRFGKTFSVSIWSFVVALCVSGSEISIFAGGKRQSQALMQNVYNYVKKYDELDRVIRKNEEKMVLRCLDGNESVINAYPSAVKTLKGVAGSVLILEEMAVIDPEVVYQVVTPLMQLDKTALVGISTITGEDNYMSKYLVAKDPNGEPLFNSRHFFLACKSCMDAGRAAKCSHNSYLLPNWSSARKRKIINALMAGQEMLLEQEIGGIASSVNVRAFPAAMVQRFFSLDRWQVDPLAYYHQIFIAVDPNGAGKDSDFAVVSMLRYDGKFILLGLESFPSKSARDNHALLLSHVARLEAIPCFANSMKVFILESNLGLESEHISSMLREQGVSNYLVMSQSEKDGRVGFFTTNKMKMLAVEHVREKLVEKTLRLVPTKEIVCVSKKNSEIVEVLQTQLENFQEVVKSHEINKPRKFYSGKTAGKDDLVMTLLLCVYWSSFLYNCPRYWDRLR